MLSREGIRVVLVFDGGALPAKQGENAERRSQREEFRKRARELWAAGNVAAATECYQKAVNITAEVSRRLILELRRRRVEYVVAPYEADAQMAYLALSGLVDAVLTEDSDLLAYGCPRVLFKLDRTGTVSEVLARDFPRCRELNLAGFSHRMFLEMCVMAGCDFLPSPRGVGIKKAHDAIRRWRSFPRACKQLRFQGTSLPAGYEGAFQCAVWTFCHQRVFCPRRKEVVHLTPVPGGALSPDPELRKLFAGQCEGLGEDDSFLGPPLPGPLTLGLVRGDLHPRTREPFADEVPPPRAAGGGGAARPPGTFHSGGPAPPPLTPPLTMFFPKGSAARDGAAGAFKPHRPRDAGAASAGAAASAAAAAPAPGRAPAPAGPVVASPFFAAGTAAGGAGAAPRGTLREEVGPAPARRRGGDADAGGGASPGGRGAAPAAVEAAREAGGGGPRQRRAGEGDGVRGEGGGAAD